MLGDVDVGDGDFVAFFEGLGGDEVEFGGAGAEGGPCGGGAGVLDLRHKKKKVGVMNISM